MNQPKLILLSTITASLLVLAGCTAQTSTNTNAVANTNTTNDNANVEVVVNTNETVDNGNTNTSNIDTTDWLTYENKGMGVRFSYPAEWIFDEYYENDSWKKKSDEASAWVKFITQNGDKLIISRGRNETIKEETDEPTEITYTEVEYTPIDGYNAAQIKSTNEFVSSEISTETWIEIDDDLIRMPDIKEFPELEQVIVSFEIIDE